ncbi:hypothetical protein APHWI1_0645 [Anaplasma phagocytophilum str. ApWI1]|uniref:Uncharacterized protein n=1 Tax=Anaplasma phagocytophilum str. ApWI1 TaxID=1359155 RepID=A0A0F3PWF3_ANAPH|nr:hypothetical protein YYY_05145 [Anaplasma phagocytophilum str. Dog2]KJV82776.1 hypothetical protein APHHGE2_1438 [Anaplasma phagocytophilum str. HGE2]KJV84216.1 hypothetical protein APHWI1_0645 [Anaplasma phagocytophilum str. ApWI1]KJV97627.1 hypothetical protein OTSANNIE_1652 [Anaplasma phagocytophilum str. Annie]KJZ98462.1 hypothetical protein APHCR_0621 [Anaplasma phagocytophilum str. CR1007]KKA00026.1 hypothetical protein APHDU1_0421 [Anaplasma phagocytophilum]
MCRKGGNLPKKVGIYPKNIAQVALQFGDSTEHSISIKTLHGR